MFAFNILILLIYINIFTFRENLLHYMYLQLGSVHFCTKLSKNSGSSGGSKQQRIKAMSGCQYQGFNQPAPPRTLTMNFGYF